MKKPDWTIIALATALVGLATVTWNRGGSTLIADGLIAGGETVLSVIPLLVAAFIVAGLTQVLISREQVERWLGTQSGWRGILIACVAGAIIPGGPYVYYPIAAALLKSGAGLGVMVAFVTAKNFWSITKLPFEFGLLGPELTTIRYLLTFALPPLFGWLANVIFGHHLERIREAAA